MQELISIVMTSYNYADYIKEAIESVISQSYQNWELIIVDDGSSDSSVEIIKEYIARDSRIKLYQHEKAINKGLAASVKLGIEKASSEWITFLESDDRFKSISLEEKVIALNENPEIELLFTNLEMFDDEDKIQEYNKYFEEINNNFYNRDESHFILNFNSLITKLNVIPTFSVVMTKKTLLQECNFNPPCKASLDYYLWAQLANNNVYYLNKNLTEWRIHSNSYINRDKHSWFTRFLFFMQIYYFTIKNRNIFVRLFLMLNYFRTRLFYIKVDKKKIKVNLANHKFIYEKDLS